MADADSTLGRIDQTLTFYSAGLGTDLTVQSDADTPSDAGTQFVAGGFVQPFPALGPALAPQSGARDDC